MDLALNNQQWLMCHKTKPNQTKSINEHPLKGDPGVLMIFGETKILTEIHNNGDGVVM